MKNNKVVMWIKKHKKVIFVTTTIAVGTVIIIRNKDWLKTFWGIKEISALERQHVRTVDLENKIAFISDEIVKRLTGNMMTARKLGDEVGCSAQAINKKLVEFGLITKLPCGEYILTESGRGFGKDTWKTTASGYSFSNIEWDEVVLEIIFSQEELQNIASRKREIQEMLVAS